MKPGLRRERDEGAVCPFCDELLKVPEDIKTEMGEFTGGKCECGAVYAYDPTGHNVGEAYLDALSFACSEDWSILNTLTPGDDYKEAVFNYDLRTHRFTTIKDIRRDFSGKIVFVKISGRHR